MAGDIDFVPLMEPVARAVLGKPSRVIRAKNQLRWRENDSLVVYLNTGTWWDFVDEHGGGVLDLLREHRGLVNGEAFDWLRDRGHLPARDDAVSPKATSKPVAKLTSKAAPPAAPPPAAPKTAPKGKKVIEATYDYVDEQGEVLFQVVRYLPKRFSQRRPDPSARDGWRWDLDGVRRVPYRLPELQEAVSQDRVIFIAEGEKKVDALIKLGVPATCNAGGSKGWDPSLGEHIRGANVVILPDNDQPGRDHRDDLVKKLTGVVASIRVLDLPHLGAKGDVVNWINEAGGTVEELWHLVEAAPLAEDHARTREAPDPREEDDGDPQVPTEAELLSGFIFPGDTPLAPPRYLVKHLLTTTGVGILGGQSGAAKTFTAIELASCLWEGRPFFGHRVVDRVGTLILAAEGAGTLANRIEAARQAKGNGLQPPIVWMGKVPDLAHPGQEKALNLADPEQVKVLKLKIRALDATMRKRFGVRLGLITIDTLIAAFGLQDENNSAEAQRVITHMQELGEEVGAFVLAVHHYGKDEATGLRGSSAYRAGADVVLSLLAERNQVTGEVKGRSLNKAKLRDGEEGRIGGFNLRFVELGKDEDGDPFGACVVEPDLDTSAAPTPRPVKEPLPVLAFREAFHEVMISHGREVRVRGNGPLVRAITSEELRPEFRRRYPSDEADKKKADQTVRQGFRRAVNALPGTGFRTAEWDGNVWFWQHKA